MEATVGDRTHALGLGAGQPEVIVARSLLMVVLAVLLLISWYPFRLDWPLVAVSGVETLDDGALRFSDDEFASTPRAPAWLSAAIEHEHLEVALRVDIATTDQRGPARILALSATPRDGQRDVFAHDLMIGQDGADLVVRIVRPGSNEQGRPELVAPGVLSAGRHDIEVRLDDEATVTVDGEARAEASDVAGWAATWDPDHRLSLGNTLSGERPWSGTIARAQVVAGPDQVDLLTSEELEVTGAGLRPTPRLRVADSRVGIGGLAIGVLHVLLGAALGASLVLSQPARPLAGSLGIILLVAGAANLGKVFVATRHPSIATFLLQVGGGGLGAMGAFGFVVRRRPAVVVGR